MKKNIRRKSVCILLVLAAAAFIFAGCGKDADTKILNGDFETSETGTAGWNISDYENDFNGLDTASDVYVTKERTGNCAVIRNNEVNDTRIYQTVSVKPKTYYKITVDVKTEDVSESGAGANVSAIGATENSRAITGTTDWQTVTVYTKTAKKQNALELSFGLGGYGSVSSGTAMFDNITIEKVSSVPSGQAVLNLFKDNSGSSSHSSEEQGKKDDNNGLKLLFVTLLAALVVFIIVLGLKADERDRKNKSSLLDKRRKIDKIDLIIIAILTVACGFVSFFKLGDTHMAQTYWKSSTAGEYVTVEFDKFSTVSGMSLLQNVPKKSGEYEVYYEYPEDSGEYKYAFKISGDTETETDEEKGPGYIFEWKINKKMNINTRRIKVVSKRPGWAINEICFLRKDASKNFEIIPVKIIDESYLDSLTDGRPMNLFDEQEYGATETTYMNSTYFDEIYHARTAYEMIKGWSIYETTHPPLGKLIMSLGVRMFGMTPFGWRFMGALIGVLMIPLIYLFACKIFEKRKYAIIAAGLFSVEFMRLAHSRIATIDSYSTFFILLMYYFMYDYFTIKCYDPKDIKARIPLALCGIAFGLGAATKWTCLYAGAGLALLYFAAELFEARDVKMGKDSERMSLSKWFLVRFLPTCGICVVFFVLIPGAIYLASYLPYMPTHPNESLWHVMIENQKSMYWYHSTLDATHSFSSSWWSWPLDVRPIWMYVGDAKIGYRSTIASFGNPAIWWLSIPAIIGTVYYACKKYDKKMLVIITAFALEFLPWILVTRCAFIYHYMPCTPFVVLMIVYCLENLTEDRVLPKWGSWVYLGIAAALFVLFYPVLTGIEVKKEYLDGLQWFSSWYW